MNSGLWRGLTPSLRNTRPSSKTRSNPPTTSRLSHSSGATRKIKVAVERVVVSDERTRRRSRRNGVQDGRLHLHETRRPTALAEPTRITALRRCNESRVVVVRPQVGLAVAIAQVEVGDTGPLVTEVALGLGEALPVATLIESSPRLVRTTSPVTPTQSPRCSLVNSRSSPRRRRGRRAGSRQSSRASWQRRACPVGAAA